jgi:hypothetical protein
MNDNALARVYITTKPSMDCNLERSTYHKYLSSIYLADFKPVISCQLAYDASQSTNRADAKSSAYCMLGRLPSRMLIDAESLDSNTQTLQSLH